MSTITMRCSACSRTLTWVGGHGRCANPTCTTGHRPRPDVEGGRDRDGAFEVATLDLVTRTTPAPITGSPFTAHVADRLTAGERTHGDSWIRRPIAELLHELLEEGADLGAWGLLALQSLDGLDGDREVVERCLVDAMRAGAEAHAAILRALAEVGGVPPAGLRGGR